MRIVIEHAAAERDHAEHIRHLVALQLGPEVEDIEVQCCESSLPERA
jgi:hypothetical protein